MSVQQMKRKPRSLAYKTEDLAITVTIKIKISYTVTTYNTFVYYSLRILYVQPLAQLYAVSNFRIINTICWSAVKLVAVSIEC